MEVIARANIVRIAPRKVRLVANLIKGLSVEKARWQLTFSKKLSSTNLLKILNAAVANAKENYDLAEANLKIKEITVDGGPTLKRSTPRAHGRATPIRKRTSQIKLVLTEIVESGKSKPVKEALTGDIIKVGSGKAEEFDELKAISEKKAAGPVEKTDKKIAGKKGFASKVLNRKTGSK